MQAEEFDYMNELKIDIDDLHTEWMNQPLLFMKYSEKAVQSRMAMDKAKEHMEVTRAQLDRRIRKEATAKLTEGQISSMIIGEASYSNSVSAYLEAKHHNDLFSAAVKSFEQRKSALENLVKLHIQGYFSAPVETKAEYKRNMKDKKIIDLIKEKKN